MSLSLLAYITVLFENESANASTRKWMRNTVLILTDFFEYLGEQKKKVSIFGLHLLQREISSFLTVKCSIMLTSQLCLYVVCWRGSIERVLRMLKVN